MHIRYFLVAWLLLLSACETQKEKMIKKGYPLAYVNGYDEGCDSGREAGGGYSFINEFNKNTTRYKVSADYKNGWDDGFTQCRLREEASDPDRMRRLKEEELDVIRKTSNIEPSDMDKLFKALDSLTHL